MYFSFNMFNAAGSSPNLARRSMLDLHVKMLMLYIHTIYQPRQMLKYDSALQDAAWSCRIVQDGSIEWP